MLPIHYLKIIFRYEISKRKNKKKLKKNKILILVTSKKKKRNKNFIRNKLKKKMNK